MFLIMLGHQVFHQVLYWVQNYSLGIDISKLVLFADGTNKNLMKLLETVASEMCIKKTGVPGTKYR